MASASSPVEMGSFRITQNSPKTMRNSSPSSLSSPSFKYSYESFSALLAHQSTGVSAVAKRAFEEEGCPTNSSTDLLKAESP